MLSPIRRVIAGVLVMCLALPFPAQAAMLAADSGQRGEIKDRKSVV